MKKGLMFFIVFVVISGQLCAVDCDPLFNNCRYTNVEEYDEDSTFYDSNFNETLVFNIESSVGIINRGGYDSGDLTELDEDRYYTNPPWWKICSGILIGQDLFLTAAHCINDYNDPEHNNIWDEDQIINHWYVTFNYQEPWPPTIEPLQQFHYKIIEIVEKIYGGAETALDFAILKLSHSDLDGYNMAPGNRFGYVSIDNREESIFEDNPAALISYPAHTREKFSSGTIMDIRDSGKKIVLSYDFHASGGSSGAGLINWQGNLIGTFKGFDGYGVEVYASSLNYVIEHHCDDMPTLCELRYYNDSDNDGTINGEDPCPLDPDNEDIDGDLIPDVCDPDIDGDGILNAKDNCPYVANPRQQDSDEDGIGDHCSDLDDDGVVYIYDNCPDHYNPYKYEGSELMYGISSNSGDTVNVGAFFHNITKNKIIDYSTYVSIYEQPGVGGNPHFWQPDRDFDGIGDVCEPETRYSKVLNTDSFIKKDTDSLVRNEYLKIDMRMYGQNENTEDGKKQSLMYCNLPLSEEYDGYWGKDGFCTNTIEGSYKNLAHKEKDYSFSHGSEPVPVTGIKHNWRELKWESNPACLIFNNSQQSALFVRNLESIPGSDLTGIIREVCPDIRFPYANTIVNSAIYWDWRDDFKSDFGDLYDEELYPATLPEGHWINHFKYTLSMGVKGENDEYITNGHINADHFYNTERYARSARFYDREIGYYKWEPLVLPPAPELMIYFWEEWMREIFFREGIFKPERGGDFFDKWIGSGKEDIRTIPVFVDSYDKAMTEKDGFFYSLQEDNELETITLKYNHIENSAGWKNIVTFSNPSASLEPAGLALSEDGIFMLMRNEDTQELSMYVKGSTSPEPVTGFPSGATEAMLIESGDAIYAAVNVSGYIEMYQTIQEQSGGYSAVQVASTQKPPSRTLVNILSDETGIYIAGGGNTDEQTIEIKRDIWKFDSQNGWQVINSDTGKDIFKLFIRKKGDLLLLVSQTGLNGNNASYITVNTTTGNITEEGFTAIEGSGLVSENYICVASNDTDFWAGFQSGGHCDRFSAPQYAYKNAGTFVNDIAGFGKTLYAAYSDGIKIYDLTDPENPAQTGSISLYGPVRDLEVVGDRLYTASGNGIDILKITVSGLTLEKHISTYGDTAVLKNWNGTIIAGDGQGLKKVDTTTQEIIQQINTSGDISTLTIVDGIIHLYDWSGLKKYNAETFNIVDTDSSYKNNPRITSHDGNIFITYSGNVYELTYNGTTPVYTQKTGDSNETADGYSYSECGYFAQGSGIRISTMAQIEEAVCGNGEIEPGELCDGNSVACTTLDSDYDSGTATCNSTCDGYNESNCEEDDGW